MLDELSPIYNDTSKLIIRHLRHDKWMLPETKFKAERESDEFLADLSSDVLTRSVPKAFRNVYRQGSFALTEDRVVVRQALLSRQSVIPERRLLPSR